MPARLTRQSVEVAQQPTTAARLTRQSVEVAQQPTTAARTTRLSVEVAVGFLEDLDLGGRRSLVVRKRTFAPPTRDLA